MFLVGIDVAKRSHEACVLDASGHTVGQPLKFPSSRAGADKLVSILRKLDGSATIALEASGHYWQGLYHHLVAQGFPVVVANPLQTDAYRSTGVRKVKNDRRDAFVIADFLRIGRVQANYIPGEVVMQLRELTRFRMDLEDQIGDAKRRILTVLDRVFPEYPTLFSDVFITSSRTLLKEAVSAADFASFNLEELTRLLRQASRGRLGLEKAEKLQEKAADSLGLAFLSNTARLKIGSLLEQVELLERQIKDVEAAITRLMEQEPQHLTSIKGIGLVLAATLLAEIGDIHRFSSLESLVAYAGIDPSVFESGEFTGRKQHMSKRGSPYLRRALWLAAHSTRQWNTDLDAYFQRKIAEGKPYKVAMGALCRKLLARIYVVLKENRPYEVR
ncbi:MAG: IS110 family transposase [Syntrophomonadaceae bacterium]|nr:IS110 family transposase [Syntrophomonadaceae bacterium]